jgi:hypothetical protein
MTVYGHQRVLISNSGDGNWNAVVGQPNSNILTNAQTRVFFPNGTAVGVAPTAVEDFRNTFEGWAGKDTWRIEVRAIGAGWAGGETVTVTIERPTGYDEVAAAAVAADFAVVVSGPVAFIRFDVAGSVGATNIECFVTGYNEGDLIR